MLELIGVTCNFCMNCDPLKMEGKCSVPQWAVRRFRLDNKGKRAERRTTYKLATFRDVLDVFSISLRMYYKSGIYIPVD